MCITKIFQIWLLNVTCSPLLFQEVVCCSMVERAPCFRNNISSYGLLTYYGITKRGYVHVQCIYMYTCSLGIGLSIALKAERGIPDWLWGAVAQWSEHLQLKQEALGSIPSGCPGFFLFQLAYTNVNGMKDLWCSSTVRLLSTQI